MYREQAWSFLCEEGPVGTVWTGGWGRLAPPAAAPFCPRCRAIVGHGDAAPCARSRGGHRARDPSRSQPCCLRLCACRPVACPWAPGTAALLPVKHSVGPAWGLSSPACGRHVAPLPAPRPWLLPVEFLLGVTVWGAVCQVSVWSPSVTTAPGLQLLRPLRLPRARPVCC